jgi:phospholipid/cholesterol/gamma-HCH transport system permease protein
VRFSSASSWPSALLVQSLVAWIGRRMLLAVVDMGRMATLLGEAAQSIVRPPEGAPPLRPALVHELGALLALGMPLVALVHVGMGSFLSLQAYFGGTFVDGTGAVVGVGLIRNVAPMMAGLTMAGLVAVRMTPTLRTRPWTSLDIDPLWVPDRDAPDGSPAEPLYRPDAARLAAVRLLAAAAAGPIMGFWGAVVGTVVGWQVSQAMLGVTTHGFFSMMWEMLWFRDVTGLVLKGLLYGLLPALFACHEGLRGRGQPETNPEVVTTAVFRAVCLGAVAILVVNSGWFLLLYHAGPAFGPTLLAPKGD